jgi:hypothetical protein
MVYPHTILASNASWWAGLARVNPSSIIPQVRFGRVIALHHVSSVRCTIAYPRFTLRDSFGPRLCLKRHCDRIMSAGWAPPAARG